MDERRLARLALAMADYDAGDRGLIAHFMKVSGYAGTIGAAEGLPDGEREILAAAAILHDIGIRASIAKYGRGDGARQQIEGPPEARRLLEGLGFGGALVERVCWLIAHHHTYDAIEGMDYRILVEADFLVNLDENGAPPEAVRSARGKIFRTKAGTALLDALFLPDEVEM